MHLTFKKTLRSEISKFLNFKPITALRKTKEQLIEAATLSLSSSCLLLYDIILFSQEKDSSGPIIITV